MIDKSLPATAELSIAQKHHVSMPYPLGSTVCLSGTNFSLFSTLATKVTLLLFDDPLEPLEFSLPPAGQGPHNGWVRLMDTSLPSPEDNLEENQGTPVAGFTYRVNPRSIIMLHFDDGIEAE